ncbi:DUF2496 domain-containing protein [Algibacillus agarilyticus]|uniref:DUF2496 domain-containing protein n=1 Tax=Algibacillus agarilyticus TaxID=2234133 RepID=UPI000DCF7C8F|nr:DUF2496 domain-containing protein [Algibacillus agarilyticus]
MSSKPDHFANAPYHVRLAIDLIMQFEQNQIDEKEALQAIDIVRNDLVNKLNQKDQEN